MRILVTGASGLLGINFCIHATIAHEVIGIVHNVKLLNTPFQVVEADLSNELTVQSIIREIRPQLVLHCAAMANLDECEREPDRAHLINTVLPKWIAAECAKDGIHLIHISTDAVFDGQKTEKYNEEDTPNPLSVYARTKFEGEFAVKEVCPSALIARVNFYGFSIGGKRSLAEFFLNNLLSNNQMNGFIDVFFSPLYVKDLSDILIKMAKKGLSGMYHVASSETISKYHFGVRFAEKFGFPTHLISPLSVDDAGLSAPRSHNLALDVSTIEKKLSIEMPNVDQGLLNFWTDYQSGLAQIIQSYKL